MPKVRDAIRLVEQAGWSLVRTRGSHRHYRHPDKPGTVTIAGKLNDDLPRGTWAYVPDLPGCVATGASREEALHEISAAIRLHIESLREHHEPVPEPRCTTAVVDVAAVAG